MIVASVFLSLLVFIVLVFDAWRRAVLVPSGTRRRWLLILGGVMGVGLVVGVKLVLTVTTNETGKYTGFPLPWMGFEWNFSHTRMRDFVSPLSPVILAWDFLLALAIAHLPVWILLVRVGHQRRTQGETV